MQIIQTQKSFDPSPFRDMLQQSIQAGLDAHYARQRQGDVLDATAAENDKKRADDWQKTAYDRSQANAQSLIASYENNAGLIASWEEPGVRDKALASYIQNLKALGYSDEQAAQAAQLLEYRISSARQALATAGGGSDAPAGTAVPADGRAGGVPGQAGPAQPQARTGDAGTLTNISARAQGFGKSVAGVPLRIDAGGAAAPYTPESIDARGKVLPSPNPAGDTGAVDRSMKPAPLPASAPAKGTEDFARQVQAYTSMPATDFIKACLSQPGGLQPNYALNEALKARGLTRIPTANDISAARAIVASMTMPEIQARYGRNPTVMGLVNLINGDPAAAKKGQNAVGQQTGVMRSHATGYTPGAPGRQMSPYELALHEAVTGDIHRLALVGDKEGIVNANAMAHGGQALVERLNAAYPIYATGRRALDPSLTDAQNAARPAPAAEPNPAFLSGGDIPNPAFLSGGTLLRENPTPSPATASGGELPYGGYTPPSAPEAQENPAEVAKENLATKLVENLKARKAAKDSGPGIMARALVRTQAQERKYATMADNAAATLESVRSGMLPDPKTLAAFAKDAQAVVSSGAIQSLSREAKAAVRQTLSKASAEELAFLGGQFGQAAQYRGARDNLAAELENRVKLKNMEIAAANGASFEQKYMVEFLLPTMQKLLSMPPDQQLELRKDKTINSMYNTFARFVGADPQEVIKKGWWIFSKTELGALQDPAQSGADPYEAFTKKGRTYQNASGSAPASGTPATPAAPQSVGTVGGNRPAYTARDVNSFINGAK